MPRKGENIYKRKDGRWEGRYGKSRNENGKIKYGYVYAKTYTDVRNKLERAKKNHIISLEKSGTNIIFRTFSDVAREWLCYKKPLLKETSLSKYTTLQLFHKKMSYRAF